MEKTTVRVSHTCQVPRAKGHPFAKAFSHRRMGQDGFNDRTRPAKPTTKPFARIVKTPPCKLRHAQRWGDWHLDAERLTLDYKPDGVWRYELDLERVWDSASLLDWIFQVNGHSFHLQWPSNVMQDLMDALDDIFYPQTNLCSHGSNKELPAGFLRQHIQQSV